MTNERIRKGAVLAVALIAAVISYQHIYHLALTHGQGRLASALLALCVDGAVVVATLSMMHAVGLWLWWARGLLVLSVGATLAANVAYGLPFGPVGAVISGWPAVAFFGCAELAIGMARHAAPAPVPGPAPAMHAAPVPGAVPPPDPVEDAIVGIEEARPVPDELARHAWLRSAASGEELSDRKMAERFGRSRTYWTPRIAEWREATA